MAELPEGVQAFLNEVSTETSDTSGETTSTTNGPTDWHQNAYPSYVPPHKRPHNVQQDKFVNFKDTPAGARDKIEGVDNDKFQRLMLPVPFALPRDKLTRLKADFPGIYFHCKDNGNHDHPFSHIVTMIGTRFLQRRIKPSSKVLDVYGNPNSCDGFNKSQTHANEPKSMKALVNRCGPTDFIREVNKWGPPMDEADGSERYHRGSLRSLVANGEIKQYNVLQFVHTLYYVDFQEVTDALHAPCEKGTRVAYALVHRHILDKGQLNDGEQGYEKKFLNGRWLVKQTSLATASAYIHPDLSNILFQEKKVWLPKQGFMRAHDGTCKDTNPQDPTKGIAWDVHRVNDETWVVEMVPYKDEVLDGVTDFAQEWEDDDMISVDDYMTTPSSSKDSTTISQRSSSVVVPTNDGKFIELDIPCRELFDHLRLQCIGRKRDDKLLEQLISTANHLVNPSALFGDKPGMRCPPDKVYDVAVAAFVVDVQKESNITDCIAGLKPVLIKHARNKKLGPRVKDFSLGDLMEMLRMSLSAAQAINKTVRSKDPIDAGIGHLREWLE